MRLSTTAWLLSSALSASVSAVNTGKNFTIVSTSDNKAYDGLCLEGFHTGAAQAEGVLGPCGKNPRPYFYFYNTGIHSSVYGSSASGVPYASVQFDYAPYHDWTTVTINADAPARGLHYDTTNGFTQAPVDKGKPGPGFISCEWSYEGGPKTLFALEYTGVPRKLPCNCAHVKIFKGQDVKKGAGKTLGGSRVMRRAAEEAEAQ